MQTPCIVWTGKDGYILAKPTPIALSTPQMDTAVFNASEILKKLGQYRRGLQIQNDNMTSNPIYGKISMKIEWSEEIGDNATWNQLKIYDADRNDLPVLYEKIHLRAIISNESDRDVYIAIFDFAEDGSIEQIFPLESAQELFKTGQKYEPIYIGSLSAESDILPYEHIKLFATTLPADFHMQTQTKFRNIRGDRSSLEELLCPDVSRRTNPPRQRNSNDYWTTSQCVFRVEKKQL